MDTARRLAKRAVEDRLAACANILPGATSIFLWNEAIQTESEVVMVLKTTSQIYPTLETTLREVHPYDVPEIIATPITHGLANYLEWIADTVKEHSL
jgi:periplasmic divalent cation tolerance protein